MDLHRGNGLSTFREWFLDGNIEICAVCLGPDSLDIAAQVDDGVIYTFFLQILLYPVCDVAFGDGPYVNGSLGIQQFHCVVFQNNIFVIYVASGGSKSLCGGNGRFF